MVSVSFVQGEICAEFFLACLFFLLWARLREGVAHSASAHDWVCVFVLLVIHMKHPSQGDTGGWVMPGFVFKLFPLC